MLRHEHTSCALSCLVMSFLAWYGMVWYGMISLCLCLCEQTRSHTRMSEMQMTPVLARAVLCVCVSHHRTVRYGYDMVLHGVVTCNVVYGMAWFSLV